MSKKYKAKHLTIFYFSFIAIALFTIHLSVYQFTTSDLEHLYASNRLSKIKQNSVAHLSELSVDRLETLAGEQFDVNAGYTSVKLYTDYSAIPPGFPDPDSFAYDDFIEMKSGPMGRAYIISKAHILSKHGSVDVYFILDNNLYELSEKQLLSMHAKQIVISAILFGISLLVVFTISAKLTRPISNLARVLAQRQPDDLSDIEIGDKVSTVELEQLLNTLNNYQKQISELVKRERAFNRYASHELRSPLMVVLGAVNIMELTDDKAVVVSQRQRIKKATIEMSEFVDTLLTLSRAETEIEEVPQRVIENQELTNIVQSHLHLIDGKDIKWQIEIVEPVTISMPEFAFHILIGNLIKNAFAYTQTGQVVLRVDRLGIKVCDTGKGVQSEQQEVEGYGLGLLLVRDICHRYGLSFELTGRNNTQGSCASVLFN